MRMAIELVTKYLPFVDELFTTESKKELATNKDFTFDGAHSVRVWKIGTADMNDYGRSGPAEGNWSRYGAVNDLDASTELFTIRQDRSFTFVIDALDGDESELEAAAALARQIREKVIPEVDTYTFGIMATNAGTKPAPKVLTVDNIYDEIIAGSNALDTYEAPETGRILLVTPDTYKLMKKNTAIMMETDIAEKMRLNGVIAMIDGMPVIRVPAARMPSGFGFMIAHPVATVGVEKLAAYQTHSNPPGISGTLVEGRIAYDAYVLENKAKAIYCQMVSDDIRIKSAAYDVTAPVKAATRQTTHDGGTGYTAAIAWSPNAGTTFAAETKYTATVTLTAADGYVFDDNFDAADVVGLPATSGGSATAESVTVTRVSDTSVKIEVVYLATAA